MMACDGSRAGSLGSDLVTRLRADGRVGPVLIVADADAISGSAPAWAAAFHAAGWVHRVLAAARRADDDEVTGIAAEAESLGAATVVGVGGAAVVAAVEVAAARRGLPCLCLPVAPDDVAPATL